MKRFDFDDSDLIGVQLACFDESSEGKQRWDAAQIGLRQVQRLPDDCGLDEAAEHVGIVHALIREDDKHGDSVARVLKNCS